MAALGLSTLPEEIILHVISYLNERQIAKLQLVSRAFRDICRDDTFWRRRCLAESNYLDALERRLLLTLPESSPSPNPSGDTASGFERAVEDGDAIGQTRGHRFTRRSGKKSFSRVLANWDLSYPSEQVSWYDEFIRRHATCAVNWFQQPMIREGSAVDYVEARGLSIYTPDGSSDDASIGLRTVLAVSPLDNGTVCLWDVNGTRTRKGGILAQSRPGILFMDGASAENNQRSKRVDSGATECVSVDHERRKAYFAVQNHLMEVDLHTLAVVGCESFPWSITALSEATPGLPLTVGTTLGIHMHDHRARANYSSDSSSGSSSRLDEFDLAGNAKGYHERSLQCLFDERPLLPFASLAQPGPLSILHLPQPGTTSSPGEDIYVAGRFSNILHYDRRKFPSIMGSIHSGARLCSLTALPHSYSVVDRELRRKGELSLAQVDRSNKGTGGSTLIACGEYNTKGSLEMYGLAAPSRSTPTLPGGLQDSAFKNRQTCSQSKLLSVVNHGTLLAFSDGSGYIKWFERDGFTEERRVRIGHSEVARGPSLFASMPGSDDMARKLVVAGPCSAENGVNASDLLFWTGEKLGSISYQNKPGFTAEDFEDATRTPEAIEQEREERAYAERMRLALERQADDVRWLSNLGLK